MRSFLQLSLRKYKMSAPNEERSVFLSGNEAIAWGARHAGVCLASAYPGTPSTEILETLATFPEIEAQWATNEKVACEVAFGACLAGKRALTACKHVGLNVAMDPLMTTAYSGINAGLVVVVADDPGMSSSQNEQDTRRVAPYGKVPLIEPSSPSEAYHFIQESFRISEKFDIPVLFRITTRISHTKESFVLTGQREIPVKPLDKNPRKYVMIPAHARPRHLDLEKRLAALKEYSEQTPLNRAEIKDRKTGFITSGVSACYVKEAYPDASILTCGMSFPLPIKKIGDFAKKVRKLYVVEELEPFLEEQLLQAGLAVTGKKPSWRCGELSPSAVRAIVRGQDRNDPLQKNRRPLLCAGCPHRPVFTALKKAGVYVAGDIGCYTLGALEPLAALHTQLCMGASIPVFEGIRKMTGDKKTVAVIGDSTFFHTGLSGLLSAAHNGTRGVVLILDNAITAMTGAQSNPGTGATLQGKPSRKISPEKLCVAAGADQVDVIDPYQMDAFYRLLQTRLAEDKLSVIIARSPCRMVERSRQSPYRIDEAACKRCGLCLKLDCPAIAKRDDGAVVIDQGLCVGCGLCRQVCKFQAINTKEGASGA
jgi:indolepyruvate ferredoxin oxidoreductase alpha subunit